MAAPPSYDSVVSRLNDLVGPNPTPDRVLDAANTLSQTEIDVLAANATNVPNLNAEQKRVFAVGLSKETNSPKAVAHLKVAADDAASAFWSITNMFTRLTADLASIDAQYTAPVQGPFGPRLNVLSGTFSRTVSDSRELAVKIAVYARRFDKVIIPLCNNLNYTIEQRLVKINEFIADAAVFSSESNAMTSRFTALKNDFANFTYLFSSWALDKEATDTEQLERARRDLKTLQSTLAALESAMYVMSTFFVGTLGATAAIAQVSGPFATMVVIGGMIAALLSFGAAAGLFIAAQRCKADISDKEALIQNLVDGIENIRATRQRLTTLGDTSLSSFATNIDILGTVWRTAQSDADQIKKWLQQGAHDADRPDYMEISLNHAVSIYSLMADYLERYANGLVSK